MTPHSHICMRCNEEILCSAPEFCTAGERVIPTNRDGIDHCPVQPEWWWIRQYVERRILAVLHSEAPRG